MSRPSHNDAADVLYKQVGKRVQRARNRLGLSQDALAKQVGLTRTSITNIEHGRQRLMLHTTLDLASALGIPMEKLLPARSQNPDEREQMIHRLPDEESKVFVMKVLQDKGVRK